MEVSGRPSADTSRGCPHATCAAPRCRPPDRGAGPATAPRRPAAPASAGRARTHPTSARAEGESTQAPLLRHGAAGDEQQKRLVRRAALESGQAQRALGPRHRCRGRTRSRWDRRAGRRDRDARRPVGIAVPISSGVRNGRITRGGRASSSASAKSSAVVILRLRWLSGTSRTLPPQASTSAASSVAVTPCAAARAWARSSRPAGKSLRRLGPPQPVARDRSRDPAGSAASASFRVSLSGTAAIAPSPARATADHAVDHLAAPRTDGHHRAPVRRCTPAAARPARRRPSRSAPRRRRRGSGRGPGARRENPAAPLPPRPAGRSTTCATSGWEVKGRSARSTTGTPASRRYCLRGPPPRRVPFPAATTTTPTSRGKRPHQLLDVIQGDERDARHLRRRCGRSRTPGGIRGGPPPRSAARRPRSAGSRRRARSRPGR